jgi:hypothetical protein
VPVPEGLAGGAAADTAAMELREYCVLEPSSHDVFILPPGTTPVYRYYNNGFPNKDSNHRLVPSLDPNAFMIDQAWRFEGVAMCSAN